MSLSRVGSGRGKRQRAGAVQDTGVRPECLITLTFWLEQHLRPEADQLREELRDGLGLHEFARLVQVVHHNSLRVDAEAVIDGG